MSPLKLLVAVRDTRLEETLVKPSCHGKQWIMNAALQMNRRAFEALSITWYQQLGDLIVSTIVDLLEESTITRERPIEEPGRIVRVRPERPGDVHLQSVEANRLWAHSNTECVFLRQAIAACERILHSKRMAP